MPAKNLLRVTAKGTYSHIYNKGVENRLIFNDHNDYEVFLGYLTEYLSVPGDLTNTKKVFTVKGKTFQGTPHQPKNFFNKVELVAYNLMPDHFHLVLHQVQEGSIERFLRSLSTRYSIYFNKKYQRQGSLFEGPYKSVQITEITTLLNFVAYLEKKHTGSKYTSHNDYVSKVSGGIVKTKILNNLFTNAGNDIFAGTNSFKGYAEKISFTEIEKSALDKLMLEDKKEHLERRNLITTPPQTRSTPSKPAIVASKKSHRIPEYAALTVGFIFLLGLGVRNVSVEALQAKAQQSNRTRATTSTNSSTDLPLDVTTLFSEQSNTFEVLSATTSATQAIMEHEEPADLLYSPIRVTEGTSHVNVYTAPDINASVHKTAQENEIFEGSPTNVDWYEVKLPNGVKGFIESQYIKLEQSI